MKLKDKIKALAITAATTILTSCGFGGDKKELKVQERDYDGEAYTIYPGSEVVNYSYEDSCGDVIKKVQRDVISRDSSATEILNQLKQDNIPVIKGDSVLHDAFFYRGHFSDPHYALNKVEKDVSPNNVEHLDNGVEIRKKIDSGNVQHKIFKVDEKTIGVKFYKNETQKEKISRVRKLVEDKNAEKNLQVGDTVVSEDAFRGYKTRVVEKDGVSPTVDDSMIITKDGERATFDYKLKEDYKSKDM